MDSQTRGWILGLAIAFVVLFGGLTLSAIASAELNLASIVTFGLSAAVIGLLLIGLIGALRNPPKDRD